MCMIGKLSKDWKVDWLKHLPEFMHTYYSTRLAITRYSPHYVMFWYWPHLPINFYFCMIRDMKNSNVLTTIMLSYVNDCGKPFKRLKCSLNQRWRDRCGTTIGKRMPFYWNQVTWPWLKLMPAGGGVKWRIGGSLELYEVEHQVAEGITFYLMKNQWTGH